MNETANESENQIEQQRLPRRNRIDEETRQRERFILRRNIINSLECTRPDELPPILDDQTLRDMSHEEFSDMINAFKDR
jgi:hypothetical protein